MCNRAVKSTAEAPDVAGMVDSYRVPKRPMAVQVRTTHGGEEPVTVFLSERVEGRSGPETPLELLGGEKAFVPVELATGEICIVARDQLVWISVPPDPEATHSSVQATVAKVSIALVDGTRLEGGFVYERPDSSSRTQDHLNHPVSFVELHTPEGLMLVNKRHIAHVSETI